MGQGLRVIAYYRVSTTDQAESGAGLDAQRDAVARAVRERGWTLVDEVTDEAMSGATITKRPGLLSALDRLDKGQADGLVVAKLDRLSRSVLDFAQMAERARRRGWSIVALDLNVDTSTPHGAMVVNVMASFAQFERELIGQRTREALQAKKARGQRLGRPVELPEPTRELIGVLRADGLSMRAIAARLNLDGVPTMRGGPWSGSSVQRVLGSLALDQHAAERSTAA